MGLKSESKIREWSYWDTTANIFYVMAAVSTLFILLYAVTGTTVELITSVITTFLFYGISKVAAYYDKGEATLLWWQITDDNTR